MTKNELELSVVIIGKNEEKNLGDCIDSVLEALSNSNISAEILYIDSFSDDASLEVASKKGVKTHLCDHTKSVSASAARNTGVKKSQGQYVLFLDGDTTLDSNFLSFSIPLLEDKMAAAVFGKCEERFPNKSIYHRLLNVEWIQPVAESSYFGGNVLVKKVAFDQVGGFDETLAAGEEPELSNRLKLAGYRIVGIDIPMVFHDLDMTSFRQYWSRAYRTGKAYAEVSSRFWNSGIPLWKQEAKRNIAFGAGLIAFFSLIIFENFLLRSNYSLLTFITVISFLLARKYLTFTKYDLLTRLVYPLHVYFVHIPIFLGQCHYHYLSKVKAKRSIFRRHV